MCTLLSRCFVDSNDDDIEVFYDRVLRIEILDQESILSDSSKVLRIETIQINSIDLAAKSPFFQKMFSIGMKESREEQVTLKITADEEAAFVELMYYIKSNTLSKSNPSDQKLLELLMIADKFEVPSCVKSCTDSLLSLPMTCELALLFSGLPTSISSSGSFQPLIDSASEFFGKTLKKLDVFPEDIGDIDQAVIETVLSRDDLRLDSEDEAYDFLMKWVNAHFLDSDEKREFLHSHVRNLIRFPYMYPSKLTEFEQCPLFGLDFSLEIKSELLSYTQAKKLKKKPASNQSKKLQYTKRLYMHHPVEIIKLDHGDKKCEVLFEFEKEEIKNLERVAVQDSNIFEVNGHEFYLSLECKTEKRKEKANALGLRLCMQKVTRLTLVRFEIAYAEKRMPDEFVRKIAKENIVFNRRKTCVGFGYFLGTEWDTLLADDSKFFADGTLLLKATIHVTN